MATRKNPKPAALTLEAVRSVVNDAIQGQNDRLEARFQRIDERFDQIDARFTQVDARFGQIDVRFDGIVGDLRRLQHANRDHGRRLRALEGGVSELQKTTARLEGGMRELEKTATRIEGALAKKVDRNEVEEIVKDVLARR